ncbi:MAG: hypothetical protein ACK52I_24490, partial [Pseudomonadota bacterium]
MRRSRTRRAATSGCAEGILAAAQRGAPRFDGIRNRAQPAAGNGEARGSVRPTVIVIVIRFARTLRAPCYT